MKRRAASYGPARPQHGWHVPWNVVQVIRRRRSLQPAIRVYAGALALGLLLGLAADVLLGVPWRMLPLAVVGAVWLFFLGTAFTGPRRAQPLRRELMDIVWPRGRQERRERDDEEAFRTSGLPVFAVSGWRGPAFASGHSYGSGGDRSLTLAFRMPPPAETPAVTVETVVGQRHGRRRHLVLELAALHSQHATADFATRFETMQRRAQELQDREWDAATVPIDGEQTAFEVLSDGLAWAAEGRVGEYLVHIVGHDVPISSIRLERVADVAPYLAARRSFIQSLR